MIDWFEFGSEFFEGLMAIDVRIVEQAAQQPCAHCGGPLYRGDYPRKPRGGQIATSAEGWVRRFSLCCGSEGCRRRATPPSVRFLGRRVYVGAVVIAAAAVSLTMAAASAAVRVTGVPSRTTRRWLRWWRHTFPTTRPFVELSARLIPPVDRRRLPASLLEPLAGHGPVAVSKLLSWMAPISTTSWLRDSSFVRTEM